MAQVIQHSEKENVVEYAERIRSDLVDVEDAVLDFRIEQLFGGPEVLEFHAVYRHHFGAAPLGLEAAPAGGRAHIQHALAGEVLRHAERLHPRA